MPRGRYSRGSYPARQRRLTAWELGPGFTDGSSQGFTASTSTIIGSGVTPVDPNLTVVRLRGYVELIMQAATAAVDGFSYGIGIGIVTADAFSVGVTAVPNPIDDADWPGWIWHKLGALSAPVAGGFGATPSDNQIIEIDSKAMRKFRLNETLFTTVQVFETGTAIMAVRSMTRVLLKLA